jgi:osmotically inducible protein OsmC
MVMVQAERNARAIWHGGLSDGSGTVSLGSGVLADSPVSWKGRTESPGGATSPEELVAAAHASCYAMAFSNVLAEAGHPPERLQVSAVVGFGDKAGGGAEVKYSKISVRGRVPGMDQAKFAELAKQGDQGCPISNLLRGKAKIDVDATLA